MKEKTEILDRYKRGDKATWKDLFNNLYESGCYFAWTFVKDKVLAEDLVMEVFAKLYPREDEFETPADIHFKFFSDIKYKALSHLKTKAVEPVTDETAAEIADTDDGEEKIAQQMDRTMLIREIYAEIKKLPPSYQEVLKRHYLRGQTVTEIARDLNLKHNTVSTSKERGLKMLRDRLKNHPYLHDFEYLIFISLLIFDTLNYS